ncbi:YaaW family protein [Enterobacter cloacae]
MAAEIQTFGASSIASVFRGGKGVLYREVLCDVCEHTSVKYRKEETTEAIELSLLMKMLEKSLSEMSAEELQELADSMGTELTVPTAPLILMAIRTAVRASGFAACRLSVVMLSTLARVVLGRTLPIVTYLTLTRSISVLAGPVGMALSTGWLIADMAGPALRVTVPACLLVACLRQQHLHYLK